MPNIRDRQYVDLTSLNTVFNRHFWVGTKKQLETALANNEIAENTFVKVTDDFTDYSISTSTSGESTVEVYTEWPLKLPVETLGLTSMPYGWSITSIYNAIKTKWPKEGDPDTVQSMLLPYCVTIGTFIVARGTLFIYHSEALNTTVAIEHGDGYTKDESLAAISISMQTISTQTDADGTNTSVDSISYIGTFYNDTSSKRGINNGLLLLGNPIVSETDGADIWAAYNNWSFE